MHMNFQTEMCLVYFCLTSIYSSNTAVVLAAPGLQFLYNLIALVRWTGSTYHRYDVHAAVHAIGAPDVKIEGNYVAGSTGAAYRVLPSTSLGTTGTTDVICYNDETANVAVTSVMGWAIFPTDHIAHKGVNYVFGFKFWKIVHFAIYYNSDNSVHFTCLFLADNGLDIFPMVYGPSAMDHKVEQKFVAVTHSVMIGYSNTIDCTRDTIPTGAHMNFFRNCSAPKGEDNAKYSVMFAQFIQGPNHASTIADSCTGFTQYMSLSGHMEIESNV